MASEDQQATLAACNNRWRRRRRGRRRRRRGRRRRRKWRRSIQRHDGRHTLPYLRRRRQGRHLGARLRRQVRDRLFYRGRFTNRSAIARREKRSLHVDRGRESTSTRVITGRECQRDEARLRGASVEHTEPCLECVLLCLPCDALIFVDTSGQRKDDYDLSAFDDLACGPRKQGRLGRRGWRRGWRRLWRRRGWRRHRRRRGRR